jgi:hypothetical protein
MRLVGSERQAGGEESLVTGIEAQKYGGMPHPLIFKGAGVDSQVGGEEILIILRKSRRPSITSR